MKVLHKIFAGVTSFFALFALPSCGSINAANLPENAVILEATILDTGNGALLIAPNDEDGTVTDTSRVLSTSIRQGELFDGDGGELDPAALFAGQIIQVTYDGTVMETYPGQIVSQKIVVTGQQPESWINPLLADEFFNLPELPESDDPMDAIPTLGLEYRDEMAACYTYAARGTASWFENGAGVCADSPHPLEWRKENIPVIRTTPGYDQITLSFSKEGGTATFRRWLLSELGSPSPYSLYPDDGQIPVEDSVLTIAPEQTAAYLFEVTCKWEEGTVSYVFATEPWQSTDHGKTGQTSGSSPSQPPAEEPMTLTMAKDAFSLKEDTEIGYVLKNNQDKSSMVTFIPMLERQKEKDWEPVPLTQGFCGMPDTVGAASIVEGKAPIEWYESLTPGHYRLSFQWYSDGENWESRKTVSAEFDWVE